MDVRVQTHYQLDQQSAEAFEEVDDGVDAVFLLPQHGHHHHPGQPQQPFQHLPLLPPQLAQSFASLAVQPVDALIDQIYEAAEGSLDLLAFGPVAQIDLEPNLKREGLASECHHIEQPSNVELFFLRQKQSKILLGDVRNARLLQLEVEFVEGAQLQGRLFGKRGGVDSGEL
jgi:hypothetical protein